jgi:ABC-2 type transport system ATP-binding protein
VTSPAIQARGLGKRYGTHAALDGLTLDVFPRQVFGLVGPDGAGKSTAIRVLSTATAPTSGTAAIMGLDVTADVARVRGQVGVVPQSFTLYGDLTVAENLDFYATVYGMDLSMARATYGNLLALARLVGHERKMASDLSGGMKRKLSVVCALVHQPSVLLLDEPTAGVDPVSRRELWGMITHLVFGGMAVLISTAYMDEAERCHQLAFLHQGRVVAMGTPNDLRLLVREQIVHLTGSGVGALADLIAQVPGVADVRVMGNRLHVAVSAKDGPTLQQLAAVALDSGVPDAVVRAASPSMEDVFLSIRRSGAQAPA